MPWRRTIGGWSFCWPATNCNVARTVFLSRVDGARSILILGEGNGRFLAECRQKLPAAHITCTDASAQMLAIAKARLRHHGLTAEATDFVHADVLKWEPPARAFDLIVTHFFLDCFRLDQLERIITKLAGAAMPQATWLLADFNIPAAGIIRYRAKLIHLLMYVFFRAVANLPARKLTPPDELLRTQNFALRERKVREWGLLHTDIWVRGPSDLDPFGRNAGPAAALREGQRRHTTPLTGRQ